MNPRFSEEIAFYERILDNYTQLNPQLPPDQAETFVFRELTALMGDIATANPEDPHTKIRMEEIAKNGIILLLSLFEHKDQAVEYKNYEMLEEWEKNTLSAQLNPYYL